MKLPSSSTRRRGRQSGFFLVVVMFIIISLMMTYLAANHRRITNLRTEIRLVEKKQIRRLDRVSLAPTNRPAVQRVAVVSP